MFVEHNTQYTSFSSRKQPANTGSERKQFTENASVALQQTILTHICAYKMPSRCYHQLVDKMNGIECTALKVFTSEFKLCTNPVKNLHRNVCAAHINNFSSDLVEHVDFSDSRVALLWAGL